jgi:hypothetical protein
MSEPMVEARALTKIHPPRGGAPALVAVDGIDFDQPLPPIEQIWDWSANA